MAMNVDIRQWMSFMSDKIVRRARAFRFGRNALGCSRSSMGGGKP